MRSHTTSAASRAQRPRSRPGEMIALFARGTTLRPCLPVAAVVGSVLSAINEGARIATGHAGWPTWVQVGLNFLVPFLVSSYGYLTAQTAASCSAAVSRRNRNPDLYRRHGLQTDRRSRT